MKPFDQIERERDAKLEKERDKSFKCDCGFQFSGPGEYRNHEAYVDFTSRSCVICPECGGHYIKRPIAAPSKP